MKKSVMSLALAVCLAGCAATGPKHKNYKALDAACIKGDTANLVKFFSEGEAHVYIKEIDGVPTGTEEFYCIAPGKHRLGISAYNNYQTAQDYVDLEFEARKKYWLRANLRGISFVFQLIDITNEPASKIAEFSLKVGSTSQHMTIPIFIPAR